MVNEHNKENIPKRVGNGLDWNKLTAISWTLTRPSAEFFIYFDNCELERSLTPRVAWSIQIQKVYVRGEDVLSCSGILLQTCVITVKKKKRKKVTQ
jgi:hypothetical protein